MSAMNRIFPFFISFFLLSITMSSQQSTYSQAFTNFLDDPVLSSATVGFTLVDSKTRHEEFSYSKERSMVPASSLKVITCATVLEMFGADYTFKTKLGITGKIEEGTLYGDILIQGEGDPALMSKYFKEHYAQLFADWKDVLAQGGINHVAGRVIGIGNYFDQEPLQGSTSIADAGNYYAAGANGLSYEDNAFTIYFKTEGKDGGKTQVMRTSSKVPGLKITNQVVASKSSKDNAYVYGIPGTFERVIMGEIPMGKSDYGIDAALPDPALQFAYEFQSFLVDGGLTFDKEAESWLAEKLPYDENRIRNLAVFESPKLQEIVNYTLKGSVNTFADAMIKHIGKKYFGAGSYVNGTRALKALWGERGVPTEGWYQKDGSGLSRANSITSQQLALITAKVNEPFKSQLKQGMKPLDQGGRVLAKSGYMERVRSYTGYITMQDGSEKAFCIIVNNHSCTPREMKSKIIRMLEQISAAS